MSIQLRPSVPLVTLVKTEPPTVIKNEPPEEALEKEISPDIKNIDIVYHSLHEDLIKNETVPENILETKYLESVETRVSVKTEDTSNEENVTRGTDQEVIEVQALHEHSNAPSNLESDEQYVLDFSKNVNVKNRKSKGPKKTDSAECYKTDATTLWEKEKGKIKVIKAPVILIEAHEYTSLANDRHVCNHCQHEYNTLSILKRHIKRIHREVTTLYQCPYCPYKSKWSVRDHIILKHKDTKDIQWFQCHLCEKKFKLKGTLTKHNKIHLIHEQMQDGLDLKSIGPHEYTSLAKDRYVCNHCQHTFNTLSNLKRHIEKIHREVTTMYQCPYCPYKSKWSECVKKHIILKHKVSKDIQWFQCNLCEMKFKLKSDLARHIKVHLRHKQMKDGLDPREIRYHCEFCNYKTYAITLLNSHKIIHLKPEDIKYFYCYHCSYKSNRKMTLKGHIFTHHFKHVKREKGYHCNKCDYKTDISTHLKMHKLNHLKPEDIPYFHCYHCSYKAKQKWNLKEHIFRHFKKEQVKFECFICNFMTPKRDSIIKHIKKHSKVQNKSEINEGS